MERDRIIEILLGVILIMSILLLVFVFLVIDYSFNENSEKNSYSVVNSYTTYSSSENLRGYEYYYNPRYLPVYNYRDYHLKDSSKDYSSRLVYENFEGIFGNEIDKYVVYVKNFDDEPQYFTVKFYFITISGEKISESMTKYIKPHQEKGFFYQTNYGENYKDFYYDVLIE